MATITKRGKSYLVRWYDLSGTQRARSVKTAQAAKDLCKDIAREHDLGRDWEVQRAHQGPDLIAASAEYLADLARYRSAATVYGRTMHLRTWFGWLASIDPAMGFGRMTKSMLSAWYASLDTYTPGPRSERGLKRSKTDKPAPAKKYGEQSRHNRVGAVLRFWRWLADSDEYGHLVARPPSTFALQPITAEPTLAATWAECDAMIAELGRGKGKGSVSVVNLRAVTIMRYTGLRVGQVLRLEWRDFDLAAGTLVVRGELGKSRAEKSGRRIPISPALVQAMTGWGVREGRVVPGKPSPASVSKAVAKAWRAVADVGLVRRGVFEHRPDHAMRRAFTSELKRAGAEVEAVEHLIGHAAPGSRVFYLDPDALDLRQAVDLVAAIGSAAGPRPLAARAAVSDTHDHGVIRLRSTAS